MRMISRSCFIRNWFFHHSLFTYRHKVEPGTWSWFTTLPCSGSWSQSFVWSDQGTLTRPSRPPDLWYNWYRII